MLKINDCIEIKIEDVAFSNKGYGFYDGVKVIVKNSLPGQRILARVIKKRKGAFEAVLVSTVNRAPFEIEPLCPHFKLCGGCTYQNYEHEAEIRLKERQILKLLNDNIGSDFEFLGITPSPLLEGYRNKCEFSFGDEEKGGRLALGMRKRNSFYEVVTLTGCNIVDKDNIKIINFTRDFFEAKGLSFYNRMRKEGELRNLVVRKAKKTGEILVNIITFNTISPEIYEYAKLLSELSLEGTICGILHTKNGSVADVVKSDKTTVLYGRDYFYENILGLTFKISAFSFFQTNSEGAEELYSIVKNFVGDASDKIIFDLYCGTGTIAQILAKNCKNVLGIEIVDEAVLAAKENARENGIENCDFIAGDVLKKVDEISIKPDIIILDPPREGIHPKAIGKIIDFGAPKIVYVSCKPSSLAKDLKIFEQNGYKAEKIKGMDMFPRTGHVETVVLITHNI